MKTLLQTVAVAFSMFSAIPMPYFDWNEKNTKYMLLAFPLVGVVLGVTSMLVVEIAVICGLSNMFTSILLVISPIAITGGIHLDGYCDTRDALSSHQPIEKKLLILSDPHIGAFGVLSLICYLLLYLGVMFEIEKNFTNIVIISAIYVITRCFSGIGVTTIVSAKSSGLAKTFSDSADKLRVRNVLVFALVVIYLLLVYLLGWKALILLIVSVVTYFCWYKMILKEFGGITGDLSGYLTQKMELYLLFTVLLIGLR